jgi:hypothetical protein
MKPQSARTATVKRRPMAKALTLAALALLFTMSFVPQSFAAAKAPDIDPSRYSVGNMVYPPGVKPPEADKAQTKGKSAKGKKSRAIAIQPKPKDTRTDKSNE